MPDKKVPVASPKAPVVKVQTPVIKPTHTPMPGNPPTLMRVKDSVDRAKKKTKSGFLEFVFSYSVIFLIFVFC
jgi:hypothetical protein